MIDSGTTKRWICMGLAGLLIVLAGCSPYARLKGDESTRDRFSAETFSDILDEHAGLFRPEDDIVMRINPLAEDRPYRVSVQTTGVAQSIPQLHWDIIQFWSRYSSIPVGFSKQFTQEFEVREGDKSYWIAFRNPEQLRELQGLKAPVTGDAWIMLIGSTFGAEGWEPVFLLNRFQPAKNQN